MAEPIDSQGRGKRPARWYALPARLFWPARCPWCDCIMEPDTPWRHVPVVGIVCRDCFRATAD
jgi:hypothetical protein